MYLLDTDILIWILRRNEKVIHKVSYLKNKSPVCISVISIAEIYKNVFPSELTDTEDLINQHIIFDIDKKIAKMAGLYWQEYSKKLEKISIADCLVASTANIHDLTLVSLNTRHFPMKDIKFLNPLT